MIKANCLLPLIFAGVAIILLTGPYAILDAVKEENNPLRFIEIPIIFSIYFLGTYGLHTMYKTHKVNNEKKAWIMLLVGFASVLIAVMSLEVLL